MGRSLMTGGDIIVQNPPVDPIQQAKTARARAKSLAENLQQSLDDAITRGILKEPINPAINKLLAHLRARQQVGAF